MGVGRWVLWSATFIAILILRKYFQIFFPLKPIKGPRIPYVYVYLFLTVPFILGGLKG